MDAQVREVFGKVPSLAGFGGGNNMLMPSWDLDERGTARLLALMQDFNDEYAARRTVLGRRLDVTVQAFLGSGKAEAQRPLGGAFSADADYFCLRGWGWHGDFSAADIGHGQP